MERISGSANAAAEYSLAHSEVARLDIAAASWSAISTVWYRVVYASTLSTWCKSAKCRSSQSASLDALSLSCPAHGESPSMTVSSRLYSASQAAWLGKTLSTSHVCSRGTSLRAGRSCGIESSIESRRLQYDTF